MSAKPRGKPASKKRPPKERAKTEGRDAMAIIARLELTRSVLDLNQKEFVVPAGMNENTYSQYKKGANAPDLEQMHKLCDHHGITLDWIYRGVSGGLPDQLWADIWTVRQMRKRRAKKA